MMKRDLSKNACSGQATTELAVMLLGFAMLMLGLIFVFSMGIFNTRVLMNAKYSADLAANSAVDGEAGREIRNWEYMKFPPGGRDSGVIPFTLKDKSTDFSGSEMENAYASMASPADSDFGRKPGEPNYSWRELSGFTQGKFEHDFKGVHKSSIAAARLIVKDGKEGSLGRDLLTSITSAKEQSPLWGLSKAAAKVLNVRISTENLLENQSNLVYLPANGADEKQ